MASGYLYGTINRDMKQIGGAADWKDTTFGTHSY